MTRLNDLFASLADTLRQRMERRDGSAWWLSLAPVVSVILGLVVSGLMMLLLHADPISVYARMFSATFRSGYNVANIFVKATPLILTGLAMGFAFRAMLFNIGGQGQFYIGAIAAVACALNLGSEPTVVVLLASFLAAALAGGLWGAFVGYVRAYFNANEFLVSMMSTYVAIAVMDYLLRSPLQQSQHEYPQTNMISSHGFIPTLIPHTGLHWGFVLALIIALLAYLILWRTSLGYRIRAVGLNKDAARYGGINAKRIFVIVFLLSGAFAGVAGFTEVNGVQHMLVQGLDPTIGAEGIAIAILGNANPLGIVLAAILFGALKVGGTQLVQTSTIPSSVINMMEGFVMLFVILSYFAQDKVIAVRGKRAARRRRSKP
jgi:general nucleoside transport system permease protein